MPDRIKFRQRVSVDGYLDANATTVLAGPLTISNAATLSGATTISGALTLSGATTVSNTLTMGADIVLDGTTVVPSARAGPGSVRFITTSGRVMVNTTGTTWRYLSVTSV